MPYSVPWPPGAVARVPAERRSAKSKSLPSAWSFFVCCIYFTSVNMSNSVVTPKISACLSTPPKRECESRSGRGGVWLHAGSLHVPRDLQVLTDSLDLAAFYSDVGLLKRFMAVEHTRIADYEAVAMVWTGKNDCWCRQEQIESHPTKASADYGKSVGTQVSSPVLRLNRRAAATIDSYGKGLATHSTV